MQKIQSVLVEALQAAYKVHEQLGETGEQLMQTNRFGDTTVLRADIECEEAVLNVLRKDNIPIKVVSEEHGIVSIGNSPQYLGILDGIDGSSLYKKARGKGHYGTMFAIFEGINPLYSDYLVCGIMQHATGRMFVAEKGQGAYIIEKGKRRRIHTSTKQHLAMGMHVYIDEHFEYNRKTFSSRLGEFNPKYEGASSLYYAALAEGSADAVLECTRKGNLEIAVEYGLTCEAGGVIVDLEGQDIGLHRYLEFGQHNHRGVISAASQQLALELLERV
jgi:fructose-1,6-bisphosphatase/inositol monophosphatase family enzyme